MLHTQTTEKVTAQVTVTATASRPRNGRRHCRLSLLCLLALMLSIALCCGVAPTAADYLEADDYAAYDGALNSAGTGEGGSSADGGDVYDATLLQQELDSQSLNNAERTADERVDALPPQHNATKQMPASVERLHDAAAAGDGDGGGGGERIDDNDDDYDALDRLHLHKQQHAPPANSSSATPPATHAGDQVPQASRKITELDANNSDYVDDEQAAEGEGEDDDVPKSKLAAHKTPERKLTAKGRGGERIPFAMKFYNGKSLKDIRDNNRRSDKRSDNERVDDDDDVATLPLPQQQLHADERKVEVEAEAAEEDTPTATEDEDYYSDSREVTSAAPIERKRQQQQHRRVELQAATHDEATNDGDVDADGDVNVDGLTDDVHVSGSSTSTTTTTTTNAPALLAKVANIAGLPLPFSNAWRTTTTTTATTTTTTTTMPTTAAAAVATTTESLMPVTTATTATTTTTSPIILNANGINYRAGKDITTSAYDNNNNNSNNGNGINTTPDTPQALDWRGVTSPTPPTTTTMTTTTTNTPITTTTWTTATATPLAVDIVPTLASTVPTTTTITPTATTITDTTTTTTTATLDTVNSTSNTTTQRPGDAVVGVAAAGAVGGGGGKQGKQINISRRKLMAHEQLRNYIEDAYIRMPLAVIVDPSSAQSLEKTKALWHDALRTNYNIKIVLVSLNASGIPAAFNFNNTRQFLAGLNGIKEHDGGDAFIGIVHASELVPYDSAVFISTAIIPPHTELVQDAAITLLKKRIRLYVIWYGERAVSENETQDAIGGILGEVAIRSGGEILHIVGSENAQELEGSTLTLVADAFRGSQEVDVAVDTTLSNLHVKIDTPMRIATMETPNGVINLKKMVKFKSRILTAGPSDKRLDAYVPLNKLRKASVYRLRMVPESPDVEYSVFVRADRKADVFLDDMIKRFDSYFLEGFSTYTARLSNSILHSITAGSLPNTHADLRIRFPAGQQHANDDDDDDDHDHVDYNRKITFNNNEQSSNDLLDNDNHNLNNNENNNNNQDANIGQRPKDEVETFSETEVHMNGPPQAEYVPPPTTTTTTTSTTTTTLRPIGGSGGSSSAIINQRAMNNFFTSAMTKIEMGIDSQLIVAPGVMGQLYFELTNTRAVAVWHNIQVVDERRFLLRLLPQRIYLRPNEQARVIVTVLVPSGTAQGTIDRITFTCHGQNEASTSLSLNLKVLNTIDAQDTAQPSISWTFGNRCDGSASELANCAERYWTLDIRAQDWESGLLRLQATPPEGLVTRNTHTIGTTEPLRATYVASCCEPKVTLTAYDLAGNQRTYNVDVRSIYLTEAAIAAIVLGVLLLIVLILLAAWAVVWCCRRRKVSLDLPTYRSHSTRSME